MSWFPALELWLGVAFLLFGISCLRSPLMAREFERFGMARFRVLAGVLEIAGGIGLLAGLWSLQLLAASAFGLSALMLFAVGLRIRSRDGIWLTLPAIALSLLTAYVALAAWGRLTA